MTVGIQVLKISAYVDVTSNYKSQCKCAEHAQKSYSSTWTDGSL